MGLELEMTKRGRVSGGDVPFPLEWVSERGLCPPSPLTVLKRGRSKILRPTVSR